MRFLIMLLLLGMTESISAQSDSTATNPLKRQEILRSGGYIGWELTAFGENYPGLRLNYHQFITSKDFIDVTGMYVSENVPKINGFGGSVQYKRLLFKNILFAGLGVTYKDSNLEEDVILRRLGGAFFEEVDITQNRTFLGGIFSLGALFSISDYADIKVEYRYIRGLESHRKLDNIPIGSELEPTQALDDRFIFNVSQDVEKSTNKFDFNFSILINI